MLDKYELPSETSANSGSGSDKMGILKLFVSNYGSNKYRLSEIAEAMKEREFQDWLKEAHRLRALYANKKEDEKKLAQQKREAEVQERQREYEQERQRQQQRQQYRRY